MNFDGIFKDRRSCHSFSEQRVPDNLLQEIYDIAKFGPTAFNSCPARMIFVTSDKNKELLLEGLMPGNIEATKSAPVTVILAYDLNFYDKFGILFPDNKNLNGMFASNKELTENTAFRNASLQAAYFMIVARSKGLECGPMSGFDEKIIHKNFLKDENLKVNFLCNLGYKKGEEKYARLPRLDFNAACQIV